MPVKQVHEKHTTERLNSCELYRASIGTVYIASKTIIAGTKKGHSGNTVEDMPTTGGTMDDDDADDVESHFSAAATSSPPVAFRSSWEKYMSARSNIPSTGRPTRSKITSKTNEPTWAAV